MATIVISGAARGIGLELARQLQARGDEIIALCRHATSGLLELGVRVFEDVDVSSGDAMASLAQTLSGTSIDILINNAGILRNESLDTPDFESMQEQFVVNAIGPLRLTTALLPNLSGGARVVIISSRMGSISDNGSGGYYGYRASKCAANIIGVSLARDLASRGIAVGLLHPGLVATDMTGGNGIPPAEAAAGLIERVDGLNLENTGSWWHANGEILPW
ncbi:MAG: SDR family oxidoreductase [Gammaproteobacteria bacterium]|jgi:NAD(P)-dependent dehydrogenase (short-subunit alcohol dehydrogenase family)|nr:SDR family oxidoreductase [Gammaproteobacteria bacterium]